jgi:hypothetical protein
VISFSAAPEIFNTSDVWESCMLIFLNVERKATVKGQDDKGGCGVTLGEDCVGNLTQALSTAMSQSEQRNATSPCNSMTLPRIPTQCQGSISKDSLRSSMFPTHAPQLYTYRFAAISPNQRQVILISSMQVIHMTPRIRRFIRVLLREFGRWC